MLGVFLVYCTTLWIEMHVNKYYEVTEVVDNLRCPLWQTHRRLMLLRWISITRRPTECLPLLSPYFTAVKVCYLFSIVLQWKYYNLIKFWWEFRFVTFFSQIYNWPRTTARACTVAWACRRRRRWPPSSKTSPAASSSRPTTPVWSPVAPARTWVRPRATTRLPWR